MHKTTLRQEVAGASCVVYGLWPDAEAMRKNEAVHRVLLDDREASELLLDVLVDFELLLSDGESYYSFTGKLEHTELNDELGRRQYRLRIPHTQLPELHAPV